MTMRTGIGVFMFALLLAGCSDEPEQSAATAPTQQSEKAASGLCAHFSREAVDAAFDGQLPLGEMKGWPGRCRYKIEFGSPEVRDANELNVTITTAANYEEMKKWQNQSSATFEYLEGVGEEAFIVNNTDLLVRVDADTYMRLALKLLSFNEPLPIGQHDSRGALVDLAVEGMERL